MKWLVKVALIVLSAVVMIAHPQSSTGTAAPAVDPQVRPALSQDQLPVNERLDAAAREKAEADKARLGVFADPGLKGETRGTRFCCSNRSVRLVRGTS